MSEISGSPGVRVVDGDGHLQCFQPHDEVLVSWRHPRTKAPCKLSATVVSRPWLE